MRRMYSKNQINTQIEDVIKSGNVENAKPIYWHSVTIKRIQSGILDFYADLIIINNDATPLTLTTFYNFIKSLPDAEFKIVQGYEADHASNIVSYLKYYEQDDPRAIEIFSIKSSTGAVESRAFSIDTVGVEFTDNGVNKIN